MSELLLMKSIKLFLSFVCYFGTGIAFLVKQRGVDFRDFLNVNHKTQEVILWLFIIFWIIKIVWYIIDKIMQIKERLQTMRKKDGNGKK